MREEEIKRREEEIKRILKGGGSEQSWHTVHK